MAQGLILPANSFINEHLLWQDSAKIVVRSLPIKFLDEFVDCYIVLKHHGKEFETIAKL